MPIDYTTFPHIVDRILSYTDPDTWLVLRSVCAEWRETCSRGLWSRVVMCIHREHDHCPEPAGHTRYAEHGLWNSSFFLPADLAPTGSPSYDDYCTEPVPGLPWGPAGNALTTARLATYLDVLELEDSRLGKDVDVDCPCPPVKAFDVGRVPRVIRRWVVPHESRVGIFYAPFTAGDTRSDQIFISFLDVTYSPEQRQLLSSLPPERVTPEGVAILEGERLFFYHPCVDLDYGPPAVELAVVNVRYDPRYPEFKEGSVSLTYSYPARTVVVIFTPTQLWDGPHAPREDDDDEPWMAFLFRCANELGFSLYAEGHPYRGEQIVSTVSWVLVGAEQFDAIWVDSPSIRFTNPLTCASLHAGFVEAVKLNYERRFEEPAMDEVVERRGGWDEAVKFMTLDDWRKQVPEDIYQLATVPPAKPKPLVDL
ncbi:uncharacterized protein LOC62_02G003461 [Vanrija pseudolonga]|uniref:F-box domain-containing protein n=1 Tax=Vanrija pseudolonga TaxID=143232 RepID=A0AAF1BHA6_9TREE|nr:hypothetical protein LOC62_02G003461 [Vanrija pseudolonga]